MDDIHSPIRLAIDAAARDPLPVDFETAVWIHAFQGLLISNPRVFLMARPVSTRWSSNDFDDPMRIASRDEADCWHVYLAAGRLPELMRLAPYPLPFLSYVHRGRLTIRPFRRDTSQTRIMSWEEANAARNNRLSS
jgi:hypothetical protein